MNAHRDHQHNDRRRPTRAPSVLLPWNFGRFGPHAQRTYSVAFVISTGYPSDFHAFSPPRMQ